MGLVDASGACLPQMFNPIKKLCIDCNQGHQPVHREVYSLLWCSVARWYRGTGLSRQGAGRGVRGSVDRERVEE